LASAKPAKGSAGKAPDSPVQPRKSEAKAEAETSPRIAGKAAGGIAAGKAEKKAVDGKAAQPRRAEKQPRDGAAPAAKKGTLPRSSA